jgi:hypothetical protein
MLIVLLPGSAEGVFARRFEDGARCGACGRGQRIPRTRAASGLCPAPLGVPARSWLTIQDQNARRDARPGVGMRTPRWSAERRPHPSKEDAARRKTGAPLGAPSPQALAEERKRQDGVPGAAKNTGGGAVGLFENLDRSEARGKLCCRPGPRFARPGRQIENLPLHRKLQHIAGLKPGGGFGAVRHIKPALVGHRLEGIG